MLNRKTQVRKIDRVQPATSKWHTIDCEAERLAISGIELRAIIEEVGENPTAIEAALRTAD